MGMAIDKKKVQLNNIKVQSASDRSKSCFGKLQKNHQAVDIALSNPRCVMHVLAVVVSQGLVLLFRGNMDDPYLDSR